MCSIENEGRNSKIGLICFSDHKCSLIFPIPLHFCVLYMCYVLLHVCSSRTAGLIDNRGEECLRKILKCRYCTLKKCDESDLTSQRVFGVVVRSHAWFTAQEIAPNFDLGLWAMSCRKSLVWKPEHEKHDLCPNSIPVLKEIKKTANL